MSIFKEFKEFAIKGDVIDLAVAIVIGNAFGKIVSSLVQDIMMPLLGKISGNVNLNDLSLVLTPAKIESGKEITPAILLQIGVFLTTVIDFIFIAVAIFILVKLINKAKNPIK